jgi:hypothetical protein
MSPASAVVPPPNGASPTSVDSIQATRWLTGLRPEPVSLEEADLSEGVLCLVVDISADPDDVFATLRPICGEDLSFAMVEDLLSTDPLPRVQDYGREGAIRKVSAFSATAEDRRQSGGKTGRLRFGVVEFLANEHWLVACCHETQSFAGEDVCTLGASDGYEALLRATEKRWTAGSFHSPGDLGLLILRELTRTYRAAEHTLHRWLEQWEMGFYRNGHGDQDALVDLRGLVAEFRARLNAMNCPRDEAAEAWFAGVSHGGEARKADRQIDDSLRGLDRLSDMVRTSFELLHTKATHQQLELQQVQADRTEQLQEKIEKITSLFLVPTLIAGFFGANTWLPGGNGVHAAASFEFMIAAMVIGSLGAYFGLGWLREREKRRLAQAAEGEAR